MAVTKWGIPAGAASVRSGRGSRARNTRALEALARGGERKGKTPAHHPPDGGWGRRKALRMSTKSQDYLESARYCEDMAAMTGGHKVSADFAELARQWRELARQRRDFEKSLPDSD